MTKVSNHPALHATILLDYIIADTLHGAQLIDMNTDKVTVVKYEDIPSIDGGPVTFSSPALATLRNKLCYFSKGGVFIGDPTGTYGFKPHSLYLRLFHMSMNCARYYPGRCKIVPFAGGLLVPMNIQDLFPRPTRVNAPTGILLFFDEGFVKVIYTCGRISSIAVTPDGILLGTVTGENTRLLSNQIDFSCKTIVKLPHDIINRTLPPLTITLSLGIKGGDYFGGIPLLGYRSKKLVLKLKRDNVLYIYEYDGFMRPNEVEADKYQLSEGRNIIDLEAQGYNRIVSFKLEKNDERGYVYINCY